MVDNSSTNNLAGGREEQEMTKQVQVFYVENGGISSDLHSRVDKVIADVYNQQLTVHHDGYEMTYNWNSVLKYEVYHNEASNKT